MARQARRIDRKSLKKDPLLDFTSRATEYVNENSTLVLGVAAALIVGVVLLVMWGRGQSAKTAESDILGVQAIGLLANGQFQQALDHSNTVRAQFPGSRGAAIAAYVRGKAQLQLGVFVDAERAFRDYMNESSKEPFFERAAKRGLAASLEGQRRFGEAGQLYEELAAESPDELIDQTLLDAARAYELGGAPQQAKTLLERVIDNDGLQARQARIQLAGLEAATNAFGEGKIPEPAAAPAPGAESTGGEAAAQEAPQDTTRGGGESADESQPEENTTP